MDYSKIKYMHIEPYGSDEVEGIFDGPCWIFPKLDGTNAVIWYENGKVRFGSRNRELSLEKDNARFMYTFYNNLYLEEFFQTHPTYVLYGEWLIRNNIHYNPMAYYKFYIFDVYDTAEHKYLNCVDYTAELFKLTLECPSNIKVIPPIMTDVYEDKLDLALECSDGYCPSDEHGEGIIIKRYDFKNKYGRTVWAKVVRKEYKQKHIKVPKLLNDEKCIESDFVTMFCTDAFVEKEYCKVLNLHDGKWEQRACVPQLLDTVFHELVTENTWEFIKKRKNPTLDFKTLKKLCNVRTKEVMYRLLEEKAIEGAKE